jgi:23S rRNA pseudouridine1911/1915/1917 synthase
MTVINENSKPAVTNYRTLEKFKGYSLCEFRLETGRTHQIRVHASHYGHPVVGDPLYSPSMGKNPFRLTGQCLHAKVLGINHPVSGEYMEFTADLPQHFLNALDNLRKNYI